MKIRIVARARLLGYGNRGLLLASTYNTPAATLSCLWKENRPAVEWTPLLPRRPIPVFHDDDFRLAEERERGRIAAAAADAMHSAEELLEGMQHDDSEVRYRVVPRLVARWRDDQPDRADVAQCAGRRPICGRAGHRRDVTDGVSRRPTGAGSPCPGHVTTSTRSSAVDGLLPRPAWLGRATDSRFPQPWWQRSAIS